MRRQSDTSVSEVARMSEDGFRVLLDDRELLAASAAFPWFSNAPVPATLKVVPPHAGNLRRMKGVS
jgi:hypothetical protein